MKTIQKFGLPLAVIVLAIITLFSSLQCKKEQTEIEKLPAATQTGADTFGCLVDGIALKPRGSAFGGPVKLCQYQYIQPNNKPLGYYFSLSGGDSKSYSDGIHGIMLTGDNVSFEEKTYQLADQHVDQKFAAVFFIIHDGTITEYKTNNINTGELTITRFDPVSQIISGSFWFDAINDKGEKVEVREGRFDMHFIY
jgi:hypothetical protein